jgi:hypothetical protein
LYVSFLRLIKTSNDNTRVSLKIYCSRTGRVSKKMTASIASGENGLLEKSALKLNELDSWADDEPTFLASQKVKTDWTILLAT